MWMKWIVLVYVCTCHAKLIQSCPTLLPHGLQPTRLLCPWDSPGKNTGVGCRALLQGIVPARGSNPHYVWLLQPPGACISVVLLSYDCPRWGTPTHFEQIKFRGHKEKESWLWEENNLNLHFTIPADKIHLYSNLKEYIFQKYLLADHKAVMVMMPNQIG